MPYKYQIEGKLIPRAKGLDRRIKLTDADRAAIIEKHGAGASINGLAREYNVNKRLVQFILFPERHQKNLRARQERGGSKIYYNKDKIAETMRVHRRWKQKLYKDGLLIDSI